MVNYIANKWKFSAKIAEESYKSWLNGFTTDGKIPLKDLQDIYDQAYASELIPTPVPAAQVMDYSLMDEILKEPR